MQKQWGTPVRVNGIPNMENNIACKHATYRVFAGNGTCWFGRVYAGMVASSRHACRRLQGASAHALHRRWGAACVLQFIVSSE